MATYVTTAAPRMGRAGLTLAALAVALAAATAGQELPSFEVASVKRNASTDMDVRRAIQPGGMIFTNHTARQLIVAAYGVQPFQVTGGPEWIDSDRFDINARTAGTPLPDRLNLMLRSLLIERFKLVTRTEQREMPNYTLTLARADGQLGPALKPAATDCGAAGRGPGGPPPAPPAAGPRAGGAAPPLAGCRAMITPGRIIVGGQPLALLANMLSNQLRRPVIDKTGLTGRFDLELSFLPDGGRAGAALATPPPGAPGLPPIDPDAPSLFTALQEQLGLKLEAGRGPVDMIVVDSIAPPTED